MTEHLPSSPSPRRRPFRLTRYFLATGLVGIAVVTACLIAVYRHITVGNLVDHESRANADLTRAFSNHIWAEHRGFVADSHHRSAQQLVNDPAYGFLHSETLLMMKGLPVVKFKLYNVDGLTVYSTDMRQVGQDQRGNSGFLRALQGEVVSDITFRDRFDSTEGTLSNRNLIFSYIPIRPTPDAPVEAVAEVYSDVTKLLARQQRTEWQVVGLVAAMLSALYLFLFIIIRKADAIIRRQEQERAAQEAEIRHQALHDALTGLANRSGFSQQLEAALRAASVSGQPGALLFIDLDRFKAVNDGLGHSSGDALLQTVAQRLRSCLRSGDQLFRLGGDEFTVIAPALASPEAAAQLARRIIDAVSEPVALCGTEVRVGATVGIAVYSAQDLSADEVVKNADAAMYAAKQAGRGRHAFHQPAGAPAPAWA